MRHLFYYSIQHPLWLFWTIYTDLLVHILSKFIQNSKLHAAKSSSCSFGLPGDLAHSIQLTFTLQWEDQVDRRSTILLCPQNFWDSEWVWIQTSDSLSRYLCGPYSAKRICPDWKTMSLLEPHGKLWAKQVCTCNRWLCGWRRSIDWNSCNWWKSSQHEGCAAFWTFSWNPLV